MRGNYPILIWIDKTLDRVFVEIRSWCLNMEHMMLYMVAYVKLCPTIHVSFDLLGYKCMNTTAHGICTAAYSPQQQTLGKSLCACSDIVTYVSSFSC